MLLCAASINASPGFRKHRPLPSRLPPFRALARRAARLSCSKTAPARELEFLAQNTERFLQAARQRPEFALLATTFIPTVPQVFADVDRDKVLKQGVDVHSVYETLQAFMGGLFVNYFNRFGRVWQVYVQAEGEFRTQAENVGLFRVRNADQDNSAALDDGHDENDFGSRIYQPLQRLQGGADHRHPGARIQFRAGSAGVGRGVCPNHAAGNGL